MLKEICVEQTDAPLPKTAAFADYRLQFDGVAEEDVFSDSDLASGADQTLPFVFIGISRDLPGQRPDLPMEEIPRRRILWADGCDRSRPASI